MKDSLAFSSDEELNGSPKAAVHWWRRGQDLDEDGHLKVDPSKSTPRLKLVTEMERLAFLSDHGLNGLRHKILSYRAGDFWLPIGGFQKQDMDIPPEITILLTGLSASGKTSFIHMMYAVLGRFGLNLNPFAQPSGESSYSTTMCLEEHNVVRSARSGFCVYDTRGLDQNHMKEGMDEVSAWMSDGVQHLQPCYRAGDEAELNESKKLTNSKYVTRKVNFVMVVADLSQIHKAFKRGDLKPILALRALFHLQAINSCNGNPILILTHGDSLNSEDRMNGRLKICEYLGIHEMNGAYDISCLGEQWMHDEESDPVSAYALTEAVYRALLQSDKGHRPKWDWKEWIIYIFYWVMRCLASIFEFLAKMFRKFSR